MNLFGNALNRVSPMQAISGNFTLAGGSNSRRLQEARNKAKEHVIGKTQDPVMVLAEAARADVERRAGRASAPRSTPIPGSFVAYVYIHPWCLHVALIMHVARM